MKFKPIYWHIISFTIICFLSFQYWSKATLLKSTCESLNGINVQLQNDREIINAAAYNLTSIIDRNVEINLPKLGRYKKKSEKADSVINNSLRYLDDCKKQFAEYCGGWDTTNHVLKHATSNSNTTTFFNVNKIQEIKGQLSEAFNVLTDIDDIHDRRLMEKCFQLKLLLNDKLYWNRLPSLPHISAFTELSNIENLIFNDEIFFLNYLVDKVSSHEVRLDKYKVLIAPRKAVLIGGEMFEADFYISKYSSILWDGSIISVNGENIPIVDGVAHYKSPQQSIGKKTVKFNATLPNPKTGEVSTTQGEFEYEVLPKCSRDCTPLSKK